MRKNIPLHNIPEKQNEITEDIVDSSLLKMGIANGNISIDISHCIGAPRNPGARRRPIVAQMVKTKDTQFILSATRLAKGAKPNQAHKQYTCHATTARGFT